MRRLERTDFPEYASVAEMKAAYAAARARLRPDLHRPQPPTPEKAPEVLPPLIFEQIKIDPLPLIAKVCNHYGVHMNSVLRSQPGMTLNRRRETSHARQTIIWMLRGVSGRTLSQIAKVVDVAESNVSYAVRLINKRIHEDKKLRGEIEQFIAWAKEHEAA